MIRLVIRKIIVFYVVETTLRKSYFTKTVITLNVNNANGILE